MLGKILKLFVGDKSKKDLKTITPIIDQIHSFQDEISKLTNDDLRNQTLLFKDFDESPTTVGPAVRKIV